MLTDPKTGRFIRLHKIVGRSCACGKSYETTEDRLKDGRGKYCSKGCMYKYRKAQVAKNHYKWSGDKPKYSALHKWMASKYGQEMTCEWCGFETENKFQIHWANLTGNYNRKRNEWARLCAKCHYHYDREGQRHESVAIC